MPFEAEIYRVATLLIDEYGEMARIGACLRADTLADRGDQRGRRQWLRVAKAVEELLSQQPPLEASAH